jgi:hypothetical protein
VHYRPSIFARHNLIACSAHCVLSIQLSD